MEIKQLVYDLETTGVYPHKHGIHQFSGILLVGGVEKLRFDYRIQPNPKAKIEQDALDVAKVTVEQIMAYPLTMQTAHSKFKGELSKYVDQYKRADKIHLIGYNNRSFDDQFLRGLFLQNGDEYFGSWFFADSIDVMVLASDYLVNERHLMPDFKLATVAKWLGIKVDDEMLHDAHYDLVITMEIYQIVKRQKPIIQGELFS